MKPPHLTLVQTLRPLANARLMRPPVEELLRGSFETPEWADDPLEPSGETSGDPPETNGVSEREAAPERPAAPLPDPDCIEVTISGRNWGRAGPFILSERTFHRLCDGARRLEQLEITREAGHD